MRLPLWPCPSIPPPGPRAVQGGISTTILSFDIGQTLVELDLDFLALRLRQRGLEVAPGALAEASPAAWAHYDVLVDSGIVEPDRLRLAVLEVQRRIICNVLLWDQGRFVFHPGERAQTEDIMLDLDLDRLIVDALRQASEDDGERRRA